MSNTTSKWPGYFYRTFIGFVIAAVISPLVAHIPPHIGWLSFLVGIIAAIVVGLRQSVKEAKESKRSRIMLFGLIFNIMGGALGGMIGVLAAHFI